MCHDEGEESAPRLTSKKQWDKRIAKGGREIWIQASYNPVCDASGKPYKVVKFATDVTAQKLANADFSGQIAAIHKSQAVIEFETDGTIITANENFLQILGYELDEVAGKHHRIFCEPEYARSREYAELWQKLGRGELHAAEFKRLGKDGREVWLQASYNPVLDKDGEPVKVIKFATDITADKLQTAEYEGKIRAIDRSQAVVEFEMDGTIIKANQAFLDAMGYTMEEIQGRHHRMFVEPEYGESAEYAERLSAASSRFSAQLTSLGDQQ